MGRNCFKGFSAPICKSFNAPSSMLCLLLIGVHVLAS